MREEAEINIERQRRGADRGLRELQTEVARLQRVTAELREELNEAGQRAKSEAGFRRRAEQARRVAPWAAPRRVQRHAVCSTMPCAAPRSSRAAAHGTPPGAREPYSHCSR